MGGVFGDAAARPPNNAPPPTPLPHTPLLPPAQLIPGKQLYSSGLKVGDRATTLLGEEPEVAGVAPLVFKSKSGAQAKARVRPSSRHSSSTLSCSL